MPRLWSETIEAHRREVRDAILETTAGLAAAHGVLAVTMSQIAEETGIGRATLYKYYPDVEAILLAWHDRHVAEHVERLDELRQQAGTADERLEAVLETYAFIQHDLRTAHGTELGSFLHSGTHVTDARHKLHRFVAELVGEAAAAGDIRDDVAPDELAGYCLHALAAAGTLDTKRAVRRLVTVVLAGMRPERTDSPPAELTKKRRRRS